MPRRKDLEEAALRRRARTTPLRRNLILAAGWLFIALGVAGLVLPFLQGILFIVIGAIILSSQSPAVARLVQGVLDRHPWADDWHSRGEKSLRRLRARHRLFTRRRADGDDQRSL